MLFQATLQAAAILGMLASSANAHMVITHPVPFGESSLNNSPLEPDGSDFPCKQRSGVYDVTTMNNIAVGVPQKLSFKGGATHGGGSCQVSVTLDKQPTKDSDWRVIHSIVGGCPSNAAGNADGSPNFLGASEFEFSMPKGMPNGEYTLAWTWFNKIGNREMYMNCAPITVTGGSNDNSVLDTLPSMFVANIGQCATVEGEDFVFPNPGLYVETAGQTALGSATSGSCAGAAAPTGYSGGSAPSAPAPTQAPSYDSGSGSGSSANEWASQARPTFYGVAKGLGDVVTATTLATVTATGNSPAAAEPTGAAETPETPTQESETPSAAQPPIYEGNDTTSSGACTGGAVSCSNPGSVVCIGNSQWGLCNIDYCAVPRELAAGTSCSNGVVSKRGVLEHVHKHVHNGRSYGPAVEFGK